MTKQAELRDLLEQVEGEADLYPYYGVAPHECYWKKPGGFGKNPLGTSTIEPVPDWPDNFLLEVDPGGEPQLGWGACGVFVDPESPGAVDAMASETLWSKARVQAWLIEQESE